MKLSKRIIAEKNIANHPAIVALHGLINAFIKSKKDGFSPGLSSAIIDFSKQIDQLDEKTADKMIETLIRQIEAKTGPLSPDDQGLLSSAFQ